VRRTGYGMQEKYLVRLKSIFVMCKEEELRRRQYIAGCVLKSFRGVHEQ
jgi:hypothetical protein